MSLLSDARHGVRRPAHRTGPRTRRQRGDDAADLADLAGLVLDDWQQDVLRAALAVRPDGKWASFEVGLIVPRQNGKGSILEALELHALFREPDCKLILHSAHEFKTAKEAFRRIVTLIKANPKLSKRATVRYTVGEEGVELDDGSRLKFVARSSGSGRGFSGDLVILDEAYNLSDTMLSALLPTMSARPNPQLWYTSSAPLARPESDVLRKLCKRGRSGESPRLTYMEWCAGEDREDRDQAGWSAANPALGLRISPEFIENELEAMESEDFRRERLGLWVDLDGSGLWAVIRKAAWEARLEPASKPAGPPAFAFDVTPLQTSASIGTAAASTVGANVHIEVVDHRAGTSWVVPRLCELKDRWGPIAIACDPTGPAGGLMNQAKAAGLDVTTANSREHAQACAGLLAAVDDGDVVHIGQDMLDDAVAGADKRDMGDAWLWSRRKASVDISPLVAVTLAKWAWENAAGEADAGIW